MTDKQNQEHFQSEFEKERIVILKGALGDWKLTVAELQKRHDSVPEESNEWKVR